MNKLLPLILCLFFATPTFAKNSKECKKGFNKISCEGIEGAKREFLCTKKENVAKDKISKVCKKERKKNKKTK